MADIRHLRLFLSSPGDVTEERKHVLDTVEQIHYDPFFRGKITLEVVAWNKRGSETPILATMTPQRAINEGLPKPSECDIAVVIFWARMGTPLPPEYSKLEAYRFSDPGGLADDRYLSGTEWEFIDAFDKAVKDNLPLVMVYRRMTDPSITMRDPERVEKMTQWERLEAFFRTFIHPDGSIKQGYNPYEQPEDFRQLFNIHLRKLLIKLLDTPPLAPPQADPEIVKPLWEGSPFPGLRAFTPRDAPIFFGRGRETTERVKRLRESSFVAVVGASGAGKSSLVSAGLIPSLRANAIDGSIDWELPDWDAAEQRWRGLRFTPAEYNDNPFASLAAQLATRCGMTPRKMCEQLEADPTTITAFCEQLLEGKPDWASVLIYIDQFEELFTVVRPDYREPFVSLITSATKAKRIRVVATMRADFVNRLVEHPDLNMLYNNGQYGLTLPGMGALYDMIQRPAERAGLVFESGLVQTIMDETGREPGALALLAYLLDELYHACKDKQQITIADYEELGRVQGAIGKRAEETFARIPGDEIEKQRLLEHVFQGLVAVDENGTATRQRTAFHPHELPPEVYNLIIAFIDARLLISDQRGTTLHWKLLMKLF